MTLWRISRYADLSGRGGLHAAGRWHTRGTPVVYLSDHPATCLLEMLVQVGQSGNVPLTYQWLEVDVTSVGLDEVGPLPADWSKQLARTQALGDAWLASGTSAVLRVPAIVAPATSNFLLNPRHPQAANCRIRAFIPYPVDPRLAARSG